MERKHLLQHRSGFLLRSLLVRAWDFVSKNCSCRAFLCVWSGVNTLIQLAWNFSDQELRVLAPWLEKLEKLWKSKNENVKIGVEAGC
jgi:hypothetical protein